MTAFLAIVGGLVFLVGYIMLVFQAFRASLLWCLGCLLFYPVCLIFIGMYWGDAKRPFFYMLGGLGIMYLGIL